MSTSFNKICVLGQGYIGLPTAAVFASRGLEVIGVDINKNTVDTINNGKVHIVEPDLDIIVQAVVSTGNLKARLAPEKSDAFIITVPTPFCENNKPDLSYIKSAVDSIIPLLENNNLIILESTSPVGTTEKINNWIKEARKDLGNINIAYCPERVLPGQILRELIDNDRIIGGLTHECTERACELYKIFVQGQCLTTNAKTAELAKLTENAYRDVNIAFANELSLIADKLNINVWKLIDFANHHPRVNILQPGPGVGGHCIAVDPWFIVDSAPEVSPLIQTARKVNLNKTQYVIDYTKQKINKFKDPIVACLGLSFKKNVDDLRESPAIEIITELSQCESARFCLVEPNITELPNKLKNITNLELMGLYDAIGSADIILLLVDHDEFSDVEQREYAEKILIDTRGLWSR